MTDPVNLFDDNQATPPIVESNTPAPTEAEKIATLLSGIKNERGEPKYASLDKALEALAHSQSYIPTLKETTERQERELAELRAKVKSESELEETISRLAANREAPKVDTPPVSGLDKQQIEELVQATLSQREAAAVAQGNEKKVQDALNAKFGEKAAETIAAKAVELGTTPSKLGQLARENPAMILQLFNVPGSKPATTTTSSLNIPALPRDNENELAPPTKSMLSGATDKERMAYFAQVKEHVNKRLGVTN